MLHNILLICLLGLLFIRPFICSIAFAHKNFIFQLCFIFVCLLWILYKRIKLDLIKKPEFILSLTFLLLVIISCFGSMNQQNSLIALPDYIGAIFCFWAICLMDKKELRWLIPVIILSAVCVSLQALLWLGHGAFATLEFFKSQNFYYDFANELISRKRAFIPFILPSALGGFLILVLPLSIAYYLHHYQDINVPLFKRPIKNSLFLVPVVFILISLFLTRSLGPILSILLGSLIILGSIKAKKNRSLRFVLWLILSFIILLLCIRSYNVGYWRNPIFSLGQRQLYWQNTIDVIKLAPFKGVGPGNLPFVGSWFSHNSYLQLWAETGILGLLSFAFFIIVCFGKWLKNMPTGDIFSVCIAISVLSFLIHNLIDFTFYLPEVAVFWWVMFALFCKKRYTYNGS
jgi:O-antigen ligase